MNRFMKDLIKKRWTDYGKMICNVFTVSFDFDIILKVVWTMVLNPDGMACLGNRWRWTGTALKPIYGKAEELGRKKKEKKEEEKEKK